NVSLDSFKPENFFALHESLLGKSLGSLVEEFPEESIDLNQVEFSFFRRKSGGGRVLVTALGAGGDSGAGGPLLFMRLSGPSRQRVMQSESMYRNAIESQQIIRCATRSTVSEGTLCSGLNLGLDNRCVLPPFMPVQRGQDGIFASLVRAGGQGYFGYVPWIIWHHSMSGWTMTMQQRASGMRLGQIIEILINSYKTFFDFDAAENTVAVGKMLEHLGSLSPEGFEDVIRKLSWATATHLITQLDQLMQTFNREPAFWAADVDEYLSLVRNSIAKPEYIIASDLIPTFGVDGARTLTQRLIRRFGELLQIWPQMHQCAVDLRESGFNFGTQI
ncbi:MAG: hypothetical protein ACRD3W_26825, partial [Terriglobales bacterium]